MKLVCIGLLPIARKDSLTNTCLLQLSINTISRWHTPAGLRCQGPLEWEAVEEGEWSDHTLAQEKAQNQRAQVWAVLSVVLLVLLIAFSGKVLLKKGPCN